MRCLQQMFLHYLLFLLKEVMRRGQHVEAVLVPPSGQDGGPFAGGGRRWPHEVTHASALGEEDLEFGLFSEMGNENRHGHEGDRHQGQLSQLLDLIHIPDAEGNSPGKGASQEDPEWRQLRGTIFELYNALKEDFSSAANHKEDKGRGPEQCPICQCDLLIPPRGSTTTTSPSSASCGTSSCDNYFCT
ncbi:unnamed protein product, partial [Amoebophrya sp. A25]|eukprot:GSA25T00010381001.1